MSCQIHIGKREFAELSVQFVLVPLLWWRAYDQNMKTLCSGQFRLSTQLIKPSSLAIPTTDTASQCLWKHNPPTQYCRSQVVQYKGVLSEPQPILTGVPQGSILGPILFIIFFNDVHKPLQHSKIITYADDSVIYTSSKDIDTIQRSLSEDMNNLCEWFKDNDLILCGMF